MANKPLLEKVRFSEVYNATWDFEKWLKNQACIIIQANDFKLAREFIERIENLKNQREILFGK